MAVTDSHRIFVGGLAYETSDRTLESAFGRFGDILEAQVIKERETGRPRGFGFVTYSDPIAVDTAISEMNNVELDGRIISVNRAEARPGSDGDGYGGHGRSSGPRGGGYRDEAPRGPAPPRDRDECYKCGRSGHWARDCPSMGGGGGGRDSRYSPPAPRYSGGGRGRGARGGGGRYGGGAERHGGGYYVDDRYDGGRYGERDRIDPRDRYIPDRYAPPPVADRYPTDRYDGDRYHVERYPPSGYGKERTYERVPARGGNGSGYYRDAPRGYERETAPRVGGGGAGRYENSGGYRGRPGPYDRPSRGGRHFDDRY